MTAYANSADFATYGLPTTATVNVAASAITQELDAASAVADGYLRAKYAVPLTAWGSDLRVAVCKIAAYELLAVRGYNPEGSNTLVQDRYNEAIRWLRDVSAGVVNLAVTPAPNTSYMTPNVVTRPLRGW